MKEIMDKAINITTLDDTFVFTIAKEELDDLLDNEGDSIVLTLMALVLGKEEKGRGLSLEELSEEIAKLYMEIRTEALIRLGFVRRIGKWSYKTRNKCKYMLTELGRRVTEEFKERYGEDYKVELDRFIRYLMSRALERAKKG